MSNAIRFVLGLLPGAVKKAAGWLHLPPRASLVVQHVVLVFVSTFATQIVMGAAGAFREGTLWALAASAATAAGSAVWHYFGGLIPAAAPVTIPAAAPTPKVAVAKAPAAKASPRPRKAAPKQ